MFIINLHIVRVYISVRRYCNSHPTGLYSVEKIANEKKPLGALLCDSPSAASVSTFAGHGKLILNNVLIVDTAKRLYYATV